jgi:hypothetical protein
MVDKGVYALTKTLREQVEGGKRAKIGFHD